jgi:hypothetical protein
VRHRAHGGSRRRVFTTGHRGEHPSAEHCIVVGITGDHEAPVGATHHDVNRGARAAHGDVHAER